MQGGDYMRPIIAMILVLLMTLPVQMQWHQVKDCKMDQIAIEGKIWYIRSVKHLYRYVYHEGVWYNQIVE